MAMSLQDLLAAIYGGQGMSPIGQGFSPATRMPQGRRRGDARLGPKIMNPRPRPPMKPPLSPRPGTPGSEASPAVPLPSIRPGPGMPAPAQDGMQPMPLIIDRNDPNMPTQFMEQLAQTGGGGIQNRSFRMNPNMQAIIEAAARGRQRGNAPQARAQRFMRSDPSQMLGMVQR
tara:strand:+ start:582 stop:1100 length:519 start_codon:yes stop_codon:yes gene_type:complete